MHGGREHAIAMIRLFRQVTPKVRRRRLSRQIFPLTIAMDYHRAIVGAVLAPARALVERELVPQLEVLLMRHDDVRLDVRASEILAKMNAEMAGRLDPAELAGLAERTASVTSRFQRDQFMRQVRAGIGVDIALAEPKTPALLSRWAESNVGLIRSIPTRYLDEVGMRVSRAVQLGQRAGEVGKDIAARFGVAEDRARFIARDQIGSLTGELNKTRQEALGVTRAIWRTAQDERVRDEHAELEGELFEWSDPPHGEAPGQAIGCRCYGEPDFSQILEAL